MYGDVMVIVALVFSIIFLIFYFFAFYYVVLKKVSKKRFLRKFHNAICNIYMQKKVVANPTYCIEQLNLNYEKLCQTMPNNKYANIVDLLEMIIYYYDSCPNQIFTSVFMQKKDMEIRNFIVDICFYIKDKNPFISIPKKEADLMQSISYALENNNESLGKNSIKQLSQEIAIKEKTIVKKDKENQRANMVSIIGLVLTIFFGLLSLTHL